MQVGGSHLWPAMPSYSPPKHLHWEPLHCYLYVFLKSIKYLEPVCPLLWWFCTLQKKVFSNANKGHQRVPGMYKCIHSLGYQLFRTNTSPEVTSYQKLHRTEQKTRRFLVTRFYHPRHMRFVNPETFWCCRTFAPPRFERSQASASVLVGGDAIFFFGVELLDEWKSPTSTTTKNHKS